MAKTLYDLLEVDQHADDEAIRAAYKKLAKKLHPDINHSRNATEAFKALQEAYHTLIDPSKRREYDALQRLWQASKAPPDEVDVALSAFGINIEMRPKRRKKKAKPREPKVKVPEYRRATVDFEPIPEGCEPTSGGIF